MITRPITAVVIHCSATEDGKWVSIEDIDRMHAEPLIDSKNGMVLRPHRMQRSADWIARFNPKIKHCGYHRVIDRNGVVNPGRHYDEIGAHVQGSNAKSIGICMIGTTKFNYQQWLSLKWTVIAIVRELVARHLPKERIETTEDATDAAKRMGVTICGHRDFSPDKDGDGVIEPWEWMKTCPGFDVADWMRNDMKPLNEHQS